MAKTRIEEFRGAMLQSYYVRVKNKIMTPDDSIRPFMDTINEYENREGILDLLSEDNHIVDSFSLRPHLIHILNNAIINS